MGTLFALPPDSDGLPVLILLFLVQRDDMEVVDEPLYANFLTVTGLERPYRDELLSKMVMKRTLFILFVR